MDSDQIAAFLTPQHATRWEEPCVRLRKLIRESSTKPDRLRHADVEFKRWIPRGYLIESDGGKGTPRIAIFHPDETTTTQRGSYIVYFFAANKSTVTLALNHGDAQEAAAIRKALRPKDIA